MATFTAEVPINIKLGGGEELIGSPGTTYRIPDSVAEEFEANNAPHIAGFAWVERDEIGAVRTIATAASTAADGKLDVTGGTVSGSLTVAGTLAAPTGRFGGRPWYDVTYYGATGDGSTDDTVAIQAALTAAAASGGTVFLPIGTYATSAALTVASGVTVMGAGMGATLVRPNHTGYGFSVVGSVGVSAAITADLAVGATSIGVGASASAFAAGDLVIVSSEASALLATNKKAELAVVASVASASVALVGSIMDSYATADTARLWRLAPVTDATIRDLSMTNAIYATSSTTPTSALIRVAVARNVSVTGVRLYGNNSMGIGMQHVLNGRVSDCVIEDLRDDGEVSILGYGVILSGTTRNSAVTGCTFRSCRHGVTTGTSASGLLPNYGIQRGLAVTSCTASDCTHMAFDTHEDADGVTFAGCAVSGSLLGGFQVRARGVTITGCAVKATRHSGIYISGTARDAVVSGCSVIDTALTTASEHGHGVWVAGASRVSITGCLISRSAGHGITTTAAAVNGLTITGNTLYNNGTAGSGDGINLTTNVTLGVIAANTIANSVTQDQRYGIRTESAVGATVGIGIIGNIVNNSRSADVSKGGTSALGQVLFNAGAAANPGFTQRITVSTGSIAASATSTVALTWPVSFTSTSYTVQAVCQEATGALEVRAVTALGNTSATVLVKNNDTGSARTGTIHGLAIHD